MMPTAPILPRIMLREAGTFSFGRFGGTLLDILRMLSYWSMKKLARRIGEGALHEFLKRLQCVTSARATRPDT